MSCVPCGQFARSGFVVLLFAPIASIYSLHCDTTAASANLTYNIDLLGLQNVERGSAEILALNIKTLPHLSTLLNEPFKLSGYYMYHLL
jgi:hypothetical protein